MKRHFAKSTLTKAIAAGLAVSMLASTAASAASWDRHSRWGGERHWGHGDRDHDRGRDTAFAVGAGLLALGLIGALSSSSHRDEAPRGYYGPPPPPPRGYNGYNGGYGYDQGGYGGGYSYGPGY